MVHLETINGSYMYMHNVATCICTIMVISQNNRKTPEVILSYYHRIISRFFIYCPVHNTIDRTSHRTFHVLEQFGALCMCSSDDTWSGFEPSTSGIQTTADWMSHRGQLSIKESHHNNLKSTGLFNLNFQSLEVVSRYRDTQLQVTENLCYLWNLSLNIYQFFKI